MFRFLASFFQTMAATMTAGSFAILFLLLFSGFVIQKRKIISLIIQSIKKTKLKEFFELVMLLLAASMPAWLEWGFWVSPLTYGEIGLSVNEFLSPRWQKVSISFHCY